MRPKFFVLLLIASFCCSDISAGTFLAVSKLLNDDEKIQGKITNVIQSKNGLIWFGSFNGLHRYDGYDIVKYKSHPGDASLVSNRIHKISENSNGDIWCIAAKRVYLFKTKEERFIDVQKTFEIHSPANVNIVDFYPLRNGNTWMISGKGECFRFNDKNPLKPFERINHIFGRNIDINNIFLDSNGKEWILTKKGLFVFGVNREISKISFNYIIENRGFIWLSSTSGKMACYDLKNETLYDLELPFNPQRIHHQEYIGDTALYTATDGGVFFTDLRNRQTKQLNKIELFHFRVDSKGCIWGILKDLSICRVNTKGILKLFVLPSDVKYSDYRVHFKEDKAGMIWLVFFDNSTILSFNDKKDSFEKPGCQNQIYEHLFGYLEDDQGNIWFRHTDGIDKISLHNTPFFSWDLSQKSEIRSLFYDNRGFFWFGNRNEEILLYDDSERYLGSLNSQGKIEKSVKNSGIVAYSMLKDSKGRIWIGTKKQGLYLLTPTEDKTRFNIQHFVHNPEDRYSLSHMDVYSVLEDSKGNIWIGTLGGGLNLWYNGCFINNENELGSTADSKPDNIRYLSEVSPGVIAICAREGLFTFSTKFKKPGHIRFFCNTKTDKPNSLSESDVMSIFKSRNGRIYLSTNSGGLNFIKSGNLLSEEIVFNAITKKNGLASDVILSSIEDKNGFVWIASEKALTRYSPYTGESNIFDLSHFGKDVRFSEALPIIHNGLFYYGTTSGLLKFSPDYVYTNKYIPPLVFTSLTIQNTPSFERINSDGSVFLKSKERNITLSFSALDYSSGTSRISYAYYLEGIDKKWNYTQENIISYLNIPKGRHLFHLRSTNGEGVWVDNEQVLYINVKPEFFESLLGYLTIVLIIFLIVLSVFLYYRRYYRLRQSLSMEKAMTDIKLRFFTDISHELRTPLTLISGPVKEVIDNESLSDQSKQYLNLVQKSTQRMLNLVNQILDFRKVQNEKMTLLLDYIDVKLHMKRIMSEFRHLAHQHNIHFEMFEGDLPVRYLWVDLDKFEKIFSNLISNAFKYSSDGKSISIQISGQDEFIKISVIDQGIGIAKEQQEYIFKHFETVMKSNLFKASSGIGLALVKSFVELHHGRISLESRPGEGSVFTVTFFTGKEHFAKDNIEYMIGDFNSELECNQIGFNSEDMPMPKSEERSLILVVDDNDDIRFFIKSILSTQYDVIAVSNGQEGLIAGKQHWPELIVSDIIMPELDGLSFLEKIKKDPDLYVVPVILLTSKTSIEDKIQGTELGADDYISKPFSANYLRAKVAALIEQRRQLKYRLLESITTKQKLSDNNLSFEPSMPQITQADKIFIQTIIDFMEDHMDDSNLNLTLFTEKMFMGRTAFTNKFKSVFGLSPMEFVFDMRMKRAGQLLNSNEYNVSEVAYKTGFNNPKYFSTCFKKYYGETPSDFLNSKKDNLNF